MVQEPLWESKSDERSLGTDVAEEHGGYPHIGLIPRHETVGKGIKKHFSEHLWRKARGSGTRGSTLMSCGIQLESGYYKCAKRRRRVDDASKLNYRPFGFSCPPVISGVLK